MSQAQDLKRAWEWREKAGLLSRFQAIRIFHGPGEGKGPYQFLAIEKFGDHYWLTEWEKQGKGDLSQAVGECASFLKSKGAKSAVFLKRPEKGVPEEPQVLFGSPSGKKFEVVENVDLGLKSLIQLTETRHPGLFLDHFPLRQWLKESCRSLRVLNTFAYTGSLSVAAGAGGAEHVTTLDLSKATVDWARENWLANGLPEARARFIAGDYFEWLPRLKRSGEKFGCIILDPPSFSHGKKGNFSTSKDLPRLHELAIDVLEVGGFLVTSINSAQIPVQKFESQVLQAIRQKPGTGFQVLRTIGQPETFPTLVGQETQRYLKGWILRRTS